MTRTFQDVLRDRRTRHRRRPVRGLVVTQQIGFQKETEGRTRRALSRLAAASAELVLQRSVTASLVLLAFGVIDAGRSVVAWVQD